MDQLQQPTISPGGAPSPGGTPRRGLTFLFNLSSWGWGLFGMLAGISRIAQNPLLGVLCILLGIVLLPPMRKLIGRMIGVRPARGVAIGSGLAILVVIMLIGRDIQAEQAIEEQRRMKIAEEERRHDSTLIAHYPFLDRDSLQAWRMVAADSATDPGHTIASFIRKQQEYYRRYVEDSTVKARERHQDSIAGALKMHEDSIAGALRMREDSLAGALKMREDSITAAREHIRDSIAQVRETRRAAAEQQRSLRQAESPNDAGTYNGHTIHIGPRGGRYYINRNGNKTYIR